MSDTDVISTTTERFVQLRHDQLHPHPENIRREIPDDLEFHQLVESIFQVGLLQPLRVQANDDGYVIISGHRRHAAIGRLINEDRIETAWGIDCLIQDVAEGDVVTEMMLIENLHRSGISPLEEMDGFVRLSAEFGLTTAQIAERTGVPESTVKQRVSWAKLPDHWLAGLGKKYAIRDLDALAKLSDTDIHDYVSAHPKQTPTVWEIEETAKRNKRKVEGDRFRKQLEKAGHFVLGAETEIAKYEGMTTSPPGTKSYLWDAVQARKLLLTQDGVKPVKLHVETTTAAIKKYLTDLPAAQLFVLTVTSWGIQLYHHGTTTADAIKAEQNAREQSWREREAERRAKLPEEERERLDKRDAYHDAVRAWEVEVHQVEKAWLRDAKPAELITALLKDATLSRGGYYDAQVINFLELTESEDDDPIAVYASKNASNLARAAAACRYFGGSSFEDYITAEFPPKPVDPFAVVDDDDDDDEISEEEQAAIDQVQAEHEAALAENENYVDDDLEDDVRYEGAEHPEFDD